MPAIILEFLQERIGLGLVETSVTTEAALSGSEKTWPERFGGANLSAGYHVFIIKSP